MQEDALSLHLMWEHGETLRTVLLPGRFSFVWGANTLIILRENGLPFFLGRRESIPSADEIPMDLAEGESKPPVMIFHHLWEKARQNLQQMTGLSV